MIFEDTVKAFLNDRLAKLEDKFQADVMFYFGEIHPGVVRIFRDRIEELKKDPTKARKRLSILLNTVGGLAETAEKFVDIIRACPAFS